MSEPKPSRARRVQRLTAVVRDCRGELEFAVQEMMLMFGLGLPGVYLAHDYGTALLSGWRFLQLVTTAPVP